VELTAENKKQLLVPQGFAHGFVVLSEALKYSISVMNSTIRRRWRHSLQVGGIDWKLPDDMLILSDKRQKPSIDTGRKI